MTSSRGQTIRSAFMQKSESFSGFAMLEEFTGRIMRNFDVKGHFAVKAEDSECPIGSEDQRANRA
jgi:hypothetical protein